MADFPSPPQSSPDVLNSSSSGQNDFAGQSVLVWSHQQDNPRWDSLLGRTPNCWETYSCQVRGVQAYCPPPPHTWTRLHHFPRSPFLPQVSKADIQPGRDPAVFSASSLPRNLLQSLLSFPLQGGRKKHAGRQGAASHDKHCIPCRLAYVSQDPLHIGTARLCDGTLAFRTQR